MDEEAAAAAAKDLVRPLREALRQSASALKAAEVPFALGGGYALWVHGAPEPVHDVDIVVAEADTEAAAKALADAGLRIERPPEDWLFKAYWDDALVDVLHRLRGVPVEPALLAETDEHEVFGLRIPVLRPTEIMVAKLSALSEHYCNFTPLLGVVRATREALDWDRLREVEEGQPFADAFLLLADRLGIAQ